MPYDAVPTEEALTTIVGFEEARAGIYSVYLGLTGGSYVLAPEVQADAFNAVADFSNKIRFPLIHIDLLSLGFSQFPFLRYRGRCRELPQTWQSPFPYCWRAEDPVRR